jgi:hypothetical protein
MTNVMISTFQSSNFLFYVVTYHFHLLLVCISPSWLDMQGQVLSIRTFQNETNYLQKSLCCKVINSPFRKFYGRYNDIVCDNKLSLSHMLNCLIVSYSLLDCCFLFALPMGNPVCRPNFNWGARRMWQASGECLLLRGTWSFTFAFVGGLCCLTLDFVFALWIMIAFCTLLTSLGFLFVFSSSYINRNSKNDNNTAKKIKIGMPTINPLTD